MSSFAFTMNPTPFGFFDTDVEFQKEADAIVSFTKRKLGDDILSVELTKKQIWASLEEGFLEYGRIINEADAKSQLNNLLGYPTGSNVNISGLFPKQNLEYLLRMAEPYAMEAGIGGSYNEVSGSIQLINRQQDYDIYETLKDGSGNLLVSSSKNNPRTKMRIREVFHYDPQAAYRFFDTTSAVNYLNNEFAFESFTPETVFYVLPVFEDILRAGQMEISNRVRKSNYSYKIMGSKIRIYPMPGGETPMPKLWISVSFGPDPFNPDIEDGTIYGVSNMSNVPYGLFEYNKVNSVGRQWVRQYCLALCKELLGQVRSKFSSVPIPNADLTLNGGELISQGREDQGRLRDQLVELLDSLTYGKLLEGQATDAENILRALKTVPMPLGKAITIK